MSLVLEAKRTDPASLRAALTRRLVAMTGRLDALALRWERGELDTREWGEAFQALLVDEHSQAARLGRLLAGADGPLNERDRLMGIAAADRQGEFLRAFLDDLDGGRYLDDEGNPFVPRWRANLYRGAVRGTANESFVDAGPATAQYLWVLGGAEESCSDCPRLAAESQVFPFTPDTIPAFPGSGDTPCLGNCKCKLVRLSDGLESFDAAFLD